MQVVQNYYTTYTIYNYTTKEKVIILFLYICSHIFYFLRKLIYRKVHVIQIHILYTIYYFGIKLIKEKKKFI